MNETIPDGQINPQEAAARSAQLLAQEDAARENAVIATEDYVLSDTSILEEPSDYALEHEVHAYDNMVDAKKAHDTAEGESLKFARDHSDVLVEAALAEPTEAGKTINLK